MLEWLLNMVSRHEIEDEDHYRQLFGLQRSLKPVVLLPCLIAKFLNRFLFLIVKALVGAFIKKKALVS